MRDGHSEASAKLETIASPMAGILKRRGFTVIWAEGERTKTTREKKVKQRKTHTGGRKNSLTVWTFYLVLSASLMGYTPHYVIHNKI